MIKEVEKIPIRETRKLNSRAQAVRDDIRFAVDNRVSRFEFVGKIYCPNEVHTTYLNKSLVEWEALRIIRNYIWTIAKRENLNIKPIEWTERKYFEVYRYPEPDRDRIFMEIYFDKLDRLADELREVGS